VGRGACVEELSPNEPLKCGVIQFSINNDYVSFSLRGRGCVCEGGSFTRTSCVERTKRRGVTCGVLREGGDCLGGEFGPGRRFGTGCGKGRGWYMPGRNQGKMPEILLPGERRKKNVGTKEDEPKVVLRICAMRVIRTAHPSMVHPLFRHGKKGRRDAQIKHGPSTSKRDAGPATPAT